MYSSITASCKAFSAVLSKKPYTSSSASDLCARFVGGSQPSDGRRSTPVKIDIAYSREEVVERIADEYANHTLMFSDGSGYEGMVEAAVTAKDENRHTFSERKHLGPLNSYMANEAEVVGIALAVDAIQEMQAAGKFAILLDKQLAKILMAKRKHHSGHLVELAQSLICELVSTHPNIDLTIV
jgi:hypothetical protein